MRFTKVSFLKQATVLCQRKLEIPAISSTSSYDGEENGETFEYKKISARWVSAIGEL